MKQNVQLKMIEKERMTQQEQYQSVLYLIESNRVQTTNYNQAE